LAVKFAVVDFHFKGLACKARDERLDAVDVIGSPNIARTIVGYRFARRVVETDYQVSTVAVPQR